MLTLLLPAAITTETLYFWRSVPFRLALLRALCGFGLCTVLITESLSAFDALHASAVAAAWMLVLAAAVVLFVRTPGRIAPDFNARPPVFEVAAVASIAAIVSLVGWVAVLSPPNSADAMSYHLPRVLHWFQHGNVRFFPTSYLNEVMLQPFTEYVMLHLYVLAGSDRWCNLVQFSAFVGSIAGVSGLAGDLGLSRRGQVVASLFCATLPNAILQASGAKNDCVLALWLVSIAWFVVSWLRTRSTIDLLFLGFATGLALGTKGTAYLFVPPVVAGAALATGRIRLTMRDTGRFAAVVLASVLVINGPQSARNYDLSGSILGFDSAQADGQFRWRNEHLGAGTTASNALRNVSDQLGGRRENWNRGVYEAVLKIHSVLGLDPNDPGTTWRWTSFAPPRNSNHEADANNRWHLVLIGFALLLATIRLLRSRDASWLLYSIAPTGGFAAFCFYLKWQPFLSRLELPLFVIAAPLAASALRNTALQAAVCLLLVSNTRLALLENWTRPLTGERNIRSTPRESNYFNDMVQWNNRQSYLDAVEAVARTSCRTVGIDNSINHVEYPFEALPLARHPDVRFIHVGVTNPSAKYAGVQQPCAVLCLDCADAPERAALYGGIGNSIRIGRFLLFMQANKN